MLISTTSRPMVSLIILCVVYLMVAFSEHNRCKTCLRTRMSFESSFGTVFLLAFHYPFLVEPPWWSTVTFLQGEGCETSRWMNCRQQMKKGTIAYRSCCNLLGTAFSITTGARMPVRLPDRLVKGIRPVMVSGELNVNLAQRTPTWTLQTRRQGEGTRSIFAII